MSSSEKCFNVHGFVGCYDLNVFFFPTLCDNGVSKASIKECTVYILRPFTAYKWKMYFIATGWGLSFIFENWWEVKAVAVDSFPSVVSMFCYSVEVARAPIRNSKGKTLTPGHYWQPCWVFLFCQVEACFHLPFTRPNYLWCNFFLNWFNNCLKSLK